MKEKFVVKLGSPNTKAYFRKMVGSWDGEVDTTDEPRKAQSFGEGAAESMAIFLRILGQQPTVVPLDEVEQEQLQA